MQKRSAVVMWILTLGVLLIVLGAIQCVTALLVMREPAVTMMPDEYERIFLFTYLATGVATAFAGWLTIYASSGMRLVEEWAWSLAVRVMLFLLVLGIGASVMMASNPFSHLTLLFALALAITLWLSRPLLHPNRFERE